MYMYTALLSISTLYIIVYLQITSMYMYMYMYVYVYAFTCAVLRQWHNKNHYQ